MKKDLICINDISAAEIESLFTLTDTLKKSSTKFSGVCAGKTLALIFQKPSNRTRVSFTVGMHHLGGNVVYLGPSEINLGVRESIQDVAKTLSRYIDAIVLRTFEHKNVVEMARFCEKPVINGLSDFCHPCQALADVYTIQEKCKKFKGVILAYVGDGNNVCNSLLFASAKVGLTMHVGSPQGYLPDGTVVEQAKAIAKRNGSSINLFTNPKDAVKGADVIYTDVWTSMGQEQEAAERVKSFKDFQVNEELRTLAKPKAFIMHCLPAHRGQEITDEMMDSKYSIVFDQAENRMHVQKAILIKLLGDKK